MGNYITVILCTAALFLAMILQLAAKPKFAAKITGTFIVIAAVSGLFIYGYGFASSNDNLLIAIVRALLAVCGMFVAKVDFSVVSGTPIFQNTWAQLYFWVVHLFALYATASAAITTVGAEALLKLRMWLARWGDLNLIYGITPSSLEFGKALLAEKKCSVVYIDKSPDSSIASTITKAGCALRSDEDAVNATPKFLKSIGIRPGTRKVTLYAIGKDSVENLPYAKAFLTSLEECGINPEQTTLVIPAKEDTVVSQMQVLGDRYGYGYVTCFQESNLAARLLMQKYPPCNTIGFDTDGKADQDFECLIIGFGQIGQAVLRQLVMNGQFVGSTFRADIFAPDCQSANGYFSNSFESLLDNYSIHFHACSAHSSEMYRHLRERGYTLNYVVVCAGSDKTNREIAEDFSIVLHRMGLEVPIHLCSHNGISTCLPDGTFTKPFKLYQPQVLSSAKLDQMAMVLNQHYQPNDGKTALEHWMECDYFSRQSCRASTDFVPAILRAAGKTAEEAKAGQWEFSEEMLNTLGQMEHLRWNAFHFCMGFGTMSEEEFNSRALNYKLEKEANGTSSIRISKNMARYTHACLIDWDALDELSGKASEITGKDINYKRSDIKNVLAIPELLRTCEEA